MIENLSRAITDQGFRGVDLTTLNGGLVDLTAGNDAVSAALMPVQTDPDWRSLAAHLAAYVRPELTGVWILGRQSTITFVIAYEWEGELGYATAFDHSEHAWTITRGLGDRLGSFTLEGDALGAILNIAKGLVPASANVEPIVNAIVSMHLARTPNVVLIFHGGGGLSADLRSQLRKVVACPFYKTAFSLHPAIQHSVGVSDDLLGPTVTGVLSIGYALSRSALEQSLRFYRQYGN